MNRPNKSIAKGYQPVMTIVNKRSKRTNTKY